MERLMLELSKYFNKNKKAVVYKTDIGDFIVEMYLNDKIIQKRNVHNTQSAEELAEDFVLEENSGPSLLNEDA